MLLRTLLKKPMQYLGRLRFPQLFMLLLGLALFDTFTPDPIPWIDEAVLTVLTVMIGSIKGRKGAEPPPPPGAGGPGTGEGPAGKQAEKNVTPGS